MSGRLRDEIATVWNKVIGGCQEGSTPDSVVCLVYRCCLKCRQMLRPPSIFPCTPNCHIKAQLINGKRTKRSSRCERKKQCDRKKMGGKVEQMRWKFKTSDSHSTSRPSAARSPPPLANSLFTSFLTIDIIPMKYFNLWYVHQLCTGIIMAFSGMQNQCLWQSTLPQMCYSACMQGDTWGRARGGRWK